MKKVNLLFCLSLLVLLSISSCKLAKDPAPSTSTQPQPTVATPTPGDLIAVSSSNTMKDKVVLNWMASPISEKDLAKDPNLKQVFSIERKNHTEDGTENKVVILSNSDFENQPEESSDSANVFYFEDTEVLDGFEYTYNVTPWYVTYDESNTDENGDVIYSYYTGTPVLTRGYSLPSVNEVSAEWVVLEGEEKELGTFNAELNYSLPYYASSNTNFKFNIYREYNEEKVLLNADPLSELTYIDEIIIDSSKLQNNHEFKYSVVVVNTEGEESTAKYSNIISTNPIEFFSSFQASPIESNAKEISLSWAPISESDLKLKDNTLSLDNITFSIYKGSDPSSLTLLQEGLDVSTTSFVDSNLEDGVSFYYELKAVYEDESSIYHKQSYSESINSASTLSAVSSLGAANSESAEFIALTFAKVNGASDYLVEYNTEGEWVVATEENLLNETDNGSEIYVEFKDSSIDPSEYGKSIEFRVFALDNQNRSVNNSVSATGAFFGPYGFETEVTTTIADKVNITWTAVQNASSYKVVVYSDAEGTNELYSTDVNATLFNFTTDVANTLSIDYPLSAAYYFQVIPCKGDYSIPTSFIPGIKKGNWAYAPKDITASKAEDASNVFLSWSAEEGIDTFNVYRRVQGSGSYSLLAENVSGTSYTDQNVDPYTTFEYTVSSVVEGWEGPMQNRFNGNANRGYILDAPSSIKATKFTSTSTITASWDKVAAATSYNVYRREVGSDPWNFLRSTTDQTVYDSSSIENKKYEYTVEAVNDYATSKKQESFNITDGEYANVGYIKRTPQSVTLSYNDNSAASPISVISFYPAAGADSYQIRTTAGTTTFTMTEINNGGKASSGIGKATVAEDGRVSILFNRPIAVSNTSNLNVEIRAVKGSLYSDYVYLTQNPRPVELVNFTNPALRTVIATGHTSGEIGQDWWQNSVKSVSGSTYYIQCESGTSGKDNCYLTLTGYYISTGVEVTSTANIHMETKNGGAAGYLGTDTLYSVGEKSRGAINFKFPSQPGLGTGSISYHDILVDGSSGSYKVTYDGRTVEVPANVVDSSVRQFLYY